MSCEHCEAERRVGRTICRHCGEVFDPEAAPLSAPASPSLASGCLIAAFLVVAVILLVFGGCIIMMF